MPASGDCQGQHQSWNWGSHFSQTLLLALRLPLLLPFPLHFTPRKESFNFLSIFWFPGECFISLLLYCCVHRDVLAAQLCEPGERKVGEPQPTSTTVQRQGWGSPVAECNAWDKWELRSQYVINSQIMISFTVPVRWNSSTEFTKDSLDLCECIWGQYLAPYFYAKSLLQLSRNKGFTQ